MLNVMARDRIRNYALEERIFKQLKGDSVEKRVTDMTTPTLIVWGEKDRGINVATATVLHKLLPNSRVVTMPGIGHLPMIERPQQSAEDYLRFRTSLSFALSFMADEDYLTANPSFHRTAYGSR